MKKGFLVFAFSAIALSSAVTANARVSVSIGFAPFGYAPPPVIYQPDPYYQPYYEPAPAVYMGGGNWGGRRYEGDRKVRGGRGNRNRGRDGEEHH